MAGPALFFFSYLPGSAGVPAGRGSQADEDVGAPVPTRPWAAADAEIAGRQLSTSVLPVEAYVPAS
jgi:hypothetical protein